MSSLRAIGAKYRHLWPAIMEQPAAPAAARHGHSGRKREHPGRIPPALPGRAGGTRENKPRTTLLPLTRKPRNTRQQKLQSK
jgi:hypothetical protein